MSCGGGVGRTEGDLAAEEADGMAGDIEMCDELRPGVVVGLAELLKGTGVGVSCFSFKLTTLSRSFPFPLLDGG